jgi:hypothetical protein
MDTSHQIEPTSTASLLTGLSLAIDETKLLRAIKNSTAMIKQLEAENPSSHRLLFLQRQNSNSSDLLFERPLLAVYRLLKRFRQCRLWRKAVL